jgi:hypothetical protein
MSDRFKTTLIVTGPQAEAAKQAAITALKSLPTDQGLWYDEETINQWERGDGPDATKIEPEDAAIYRRELRRGEVEPHFFDHACGQAAIDTIALISYKFPRVTFFLEVIGDACAGIQGLVKINNGWVTDMRSEAAAWNEEPGITYILRPSGEMVVVSVHQGSPEAWREKYVPLVR